MNLQATTNSGPSIAQTSNYNEEYISHSDEAEAEMFARRAAGSFVPPIGEVFDGQSQPTASEALDDADGVGGY